MTAGNEIVLPLRRPVGSGALELDLRDFFGSWPAPSHDLGGFAWLAVVGHLWG